MNLCEYGCVSVCLSTCFTVVDSIDEDGISVDSRRQVSVSNGRIVSSVGRQTVAHTGHTLYTLHRNQRPFYGLGQWMIRPSIDSALLHK